MLLETLPRVARYYACKQKLTVGAKAIDIDIINGVLVCKLSRLSPNDAQQTRKIDDEGLSKP